MWSGPAQINYTDPPLHSDQLSTPVCPTDPWGLGQIRSHARWGWLCGLRDSQKYNNGPNVRGKGRGQHAGWYRLIAVETRLGAMMAASGRLKQFPACVWLWKSMGKASTWFWRNIRADIHEAQTHSLFVGFGMRQQITSDRVYYCYLVWTKYCKSCDECDVD